MKDRDFINMVIDSYLSYAIDPHMATLNNTVANRLNDIADKLERQEKVLNIIKKHFNITFDDLDWGKLVNIQAKEDDGEWDCTATADLIDYKEDFDALKEWLKDE